tara:strand:- start:2090 stop:2974 length:885 start_codon:yes stop_codon:yes gene_type:complete
MSQVNQIENIDLVMLIKSLFSKQGILVVSIAFFLSLLFSLTITKFYKSETLLFLESSSDDISAGLRSFGGLASFAGVNISEDDESQKVIAKIKSRDFLRKIKVLDTVPSHLLAFNYYDKEADQSHFFDLQYITELDAWEVTLDGDVKIHNFERLYKSYLDGLTVERDRATGFLKLTYEHQSPKFAKLFLEIIVVEINELFREEELKEADRAIAYLQNQYSSISKAEVKDSLNQILKTQLESRMLANINKDFLLKYIATPNLPEEKIRPNNLLISLLGAIFASLGFLLYVHLLRK